LFIKICECASVVDVKLISAYTKLFCFRTASIWEARELLHG